MAVEPLSAGASEGRPLRFPVGQTCSAAFTRSSDSTPSRTSAKWPRCKWRRAIRSPTSPCGAIVRPAVADRGRTVEEHLPEYRATVERNHAMPEPLPPPLLTQRIRLAWPDLTVVIDALDRLMLDTRYPLVRRLAHGVEFCDLLDRCRLRTFDRAKLLELVSLLEAGCVEESGAWFQERRQPSGVALKLFRQTLLESLRLHPAFVPQSSWAERWRLIRAAMAFSRGRGAVAVVSACRFRRPRSSRSKSRSARCPRM